MEDNNTNALHAIEDMDCTRCGGNGKIGHFKHVSGGTCFACDGTGLEMVVAQKQIAKGEKPATRNTFSYIRPNGEMLMVVIYPDNTSNFGTVEAARVAAREVIAAGGALIEVSKRF